MAAGFEQVRVGPDLSDKVPVRRDCHQPISWLKILQQRVRVIPPSPPLRESYNGVQHNFWRSCEINKTNKKKKRKYCSRDGGRLA